MKCYEEFATPTIERGDEVSIATFLCKKRMMEFRLYIEDDLSKCSSEKHIGTCAGVMKTALSVCYQCPLFQQKPDNGCNDQ